ncbi:hypothetical protein [Arthrobacter sp. CAN_A1]|uniref:hypothetical protein n=1 Tax=Arthrobacter sp. CAN_A1 TaxID=2787717 RepID=UPI0018C9F364
MTNPVESGQPEEGTRSGTLRKVAAGVLVCAVALALGIGYLASNQPGTDATANNAPVASSSPRSTAPASEAGPEETAEPTPTGTAAGEDPAGTATPEATADASSPTTVPAEEEPTAEKTAEAEEPATSDAELAAIEQPVSDPVSLEEPSVVTEGISAKITTLEAIDAEALGIGEIAGPALRFVITVENTTGDAVSLSNSVVNVEYGTERLPAVQLTGSGATDFPATVAAGGSVSTTLVFSIPADQREQVRILLNMEASSPIAAFEGAAPGEEG